MGHTKLPPPPKSKPASHPNGSSLTELVGIRSELKKLNQSVAELERRLPKVDGKSAKQLWVRCIKHPNFPLVVIVALAGLFWVLKPARYEYRIASPSDYTFEESMTEYGQWGWKAVSCRRAIDSRTDSAGYECIMLRERRLF